MNTWHVPDNVKGSLIRYRDHKIPTGGFLEAVLKNDLISAIERADDENVQCIPDIVRFCYENLPFGSWGSPKNVRDWINKDVK